MKQKFTYCVILLLLIASFASGQIEYSVIKKDVTCNNSTLGSIIINVNPINPPYTYLWNTGQTSPSIFDLTAGDYSVLVTDSSSNDTSITISIKEQQCEMTAENVFTPNSDGFNDLWFISNSQYFPDSWVLVYNRLGQKVFEHKGLYEPWDGKDLLNVTVPEASYYYIIYQDKADEKTIVKGCVSIIK